MPLTWGSRVANQLRTGRVHSVGMGSTTSALRIRVLGEISASASSDVAIGGRTQRLVLAALVARRNEPVSVGELVDVCWPDGTAPDRAEHNVRTYVHRLRAALGTEGERVETASSGYRFRLDRDELDLDEFVDLAALVDRAVDSGEIVAALDHVARADELWNGRPYGEFADEPWAVAEVARTTEVRWRVREQHAAALLAAGRPGDTVALLESMIREAPLRERPRALLMRALYESGRHAEALRAFQAFRELLADEVGVDPSADLVQLDRAIATSSLESSSARTRTVGGYELHERIGEGAFAVVHRATHTVLGREVAVKIVRAELADRPEFIRRFEAEAQMVAAIEHPNVVPLYDYWREPGQAFLVMRWMTGGSLEQGLDDGPWTLDATVELVDGIARALAAAHARGIVHRDVKPANILFDDDGRAYLGDFGIALTADERSTPQAALSEGSPIFASPEQLRREPAGPEADVHALGVVAFTLLTGRTPFADSPDDATLLRRQLEEPIPSPSSMRPGLPSAIDDVLAMATAKDPAARHPTALGFATAFRTAATGAPTADRQGSGVRGERANPYLGLRAFTESDATAFHGRARTVDELLGRLRDPDLRLLAVVGPSGSGKSSLVRAGLLPAIRSGALPGSAAWFVTTMTPGSRPFESLETALLRVAVNPPAALTEQLRDGDRGILRGLRRALPEDGSQVVVVIDQLEELFAGDVPTIERDQFLRGLAVAATEPGSPVRFVVTLRADFFDDPLRHADFAPLLKRGTVAITPLAPDELEEAITEPAADVGVGFEPGLVAEIIADVAGQPGALPLLQFALTQAFDHSDGPTITVDDYRSVGGLAGALARRADALFTDAEPAEQVAMQRLFGRLVTLVDAGSDTRRRVRRSELPTDPATAEIVGRLAAARLATLDRDPATREPTIEIAHEAILTEWPRLRRWLDDDRDTLRVRQHLAAASAAWRAGGDDADELYAGTRLDAVEQLLASGSVSLNPVELAFVDASAERREAAARRERARLRRLRRLVSVTAVVAMLAVAAGGVAVWQRTRADDEAAAARASASESEAARLEAEDAGRRADEAATLAVQNEAAAEAAAATAEASRVEAEQARFTADVQRLRSSAVAESTEQPVLAALLAVEAARLDPGRESDDALHRVLTAVPGRRGHVSSFAFPARLAKDGITMTAVGPDTVDVWDLSTMTRTASVAHDLAGPEEMTQVSPDGRRLVATGRNGTRVLDLTTGEVLAGTDTNGFWVDYAPDSTRIALAVGRDLLVLDADTLATIDVVPPADPDVAAVNAAWSPYGESMAVVWADGSVGMLDTVTWTLRWRRTGEPDVTRNWGAIFAFTPDGRRLVTSITDRTGGDGGTPRSTIRSLDVETGDDVLPPLEGPYSFWSIAPLDVHGDRVIGVPPGVFRTVAYDLRTGIEIPSPAPSLAAIGVLYSPTLDLVLTWSNSGVDLWSSDGSSPLERRIRLPDPIADSRSAVGNGAYVAVTSDGDRLNSFTWDTGPGDELDLTTDPPTPSPGPGGLRTNAGDFTLVVGPDGAWMEDADGRPLGDPVFPEDDVYDWAASSDGRYFALTRPGGVVDLYGADGVRRTTLTIPGASPGRETHPSFSRDGSLVAAYIQGASNARAVWSTDTFDLVASEAELSRLRFLLAGDVLYTNRLDLATIDRLDPHTLEPIGEPLVGHASALLDVVDDPFGGLVATRAADGSVRLWDASTGRQFGRDLPSRGEGIQFVGDGKVLSVPNGSFVSLWNLDTATWPDLACAVAGRNMTATEWDDFGPETIPYRATCEQHPVDVEPDDTPIG
jgi:serine/threonine protein kinase/WD40 repeat protein